MHDGHVRDQSGQDASRPKEPFDPDIEASGLEPDRAERLSDEEQRDLDEYFAWETAGVARLLGDLAVADPGSRDPRGGGRSPDPEETIRDGPQELGTLLDFGLAGSEPARRSRPSPLLTALRSVLKHWRIGNHRDVMGQIKTVVGRAAQRHPSNVTWISRVLEADMEQLIILVAQESAQRHGHAQLDGPGIVPRTARTGLPYATGDVRADAYYVEVFERIRSEQAVAVDVEARPGSGGPRFVVNQESNQIAQYSPATAELLRQEVAVELTPLLRELEALERTEPFACCWNPRRHGWGFRDFLVTLLQQVKEELEHRGELSPGMNNLHMAVWYVDQEDRVVSPVADTGFTDGVKSRESVAFADAGALGLVAQGPSWQGRAWDPGSIPGLVRPEVDDRFGTHGARLMVTPELTGPGGTARFRILLMLAAFAPEATELLPGEEDLRSWTELIFHQVQGYLELYPRLAADSVLQATASSGSSAEQWQAVAETMESVLRSDVASLYVRPWQDRENLHLIASTAPLRRGDGTSLATLDPESRPALSLLPSSHSVGDGTSYTGTLASRPGEVLRRNSYRHSGRRLLTEGFPLEPAPDYCGSLPRTTASSDPRCLGYALPNSQGRPMSSAVALAVRSTDRVPFKAWDAAALVAMLEAATPMIQSWRDWAAIRLVEAQNLVSETHEEVNAILGNYRLATDRGSLPGGRRRRGDQLIDAIPQLEKAVFHAVLADRLARADTVPHRLHDPIPRMGTLAALSREVTADAYHRVRSAFGNRSRPVMQATVLMEARGEQRSVMHPIAHHDEHLNLPPRSGAADDPRRLRLPDLDEDWGRFLDAGLAREFRGVPDSDEVVAGFRIPFRCWVGQHAQRGALSIDLRTEQRPSDGEGLRMDLLLLTRKLATAWTVSGSRLRRGLFVSRTSVAEFESNLRTHLRAESLQLRLGPDRDQDVPEPGVRTDHWRPPLIAGKATSTVSGDPASWDPDARLWGVEEAADDRTVALRIPLYFGTLEVGQIVARWSGGEGVAYRSDPRTTRSHWIRDILAAWSLWSWSWTNEGGGNHDDALVFVNLRERAGFWSATPRFRREARRRIVPAATQQSQSRRTRDMMHQHY